MGKLVSNGRVRHTGLHSQEAGPGIVRAAITQARQEAEQQADQVSIGGIDILLPLMGDR